VGDFDVQAKAWTYLRSNGKGKKNSEAEQSSSSAYGEG
jgi:hypothetical protein